MNPEEPARSGPTRGPPPGAAESIASGAFLLIDKPRGPSSHQVTAWVRDLLRVDRAGHAGTLDPHVSGLLWVGVGPALKLLPLVLAFPKRYVGVVEFHGSVPPGELERVLGEFQGPIYQTPPARSAVRRERRVRTVHRLGLLESAGTRCVVDVTADSGTYIRTLAVDVGEATGVGAHLTELRRVGTGPFRESEAASLSELADAVARADGGEPAALRALLHPMREVWGEFPAVAVKESAVSAIAHGADLASGGIASVSRPFARGALVVVTTRAGTLVALGEALVDSANLPARRHGWVVDCTRVFIEASRFPPRWHGRDRPKPPASESAPASPSEAA